ncbi:DnaJ molecular chaperone homology domain [Rhizoctonia solani]|uniref:DnaJ molecular chaperone homology domain n=1 Tax=Rhizoctonia solani TaxID=456999 RepID=A0A8H7H045_9AGAM
MSDLQEPGFAASDIIVGLGSAFGSLSETEKKARIKRTNGVFELRVSKDGKEAVWTVDLKKEGTVKKGPAAGKPDVAIILSETFTQLATGKVCIAQRSKSIHDRKSEGELSVSLELLGLLTHPLQTKGSKTELNSNMMLALKLEDVLKLISVPKPIVPESGSWIARRYDNLKGIKRSILSARLNADMLSYVIGTDQSGSQPESSIEHILHHSDLYVILDTSRSANHEDLRRAYMNMCRRCHPDKFPNEPLATVAFQKLSYAYSVLSDNRKRRLYDTNGTAEPGGAQDMHGANDMLNRVLLAIWADFLDGDFELIKMLLRSFGEVNPKLKFGDETIEALLQALVNLREVVVSAGQQHFRLLKFEMMRLYEIQHALRQLSYFDVPGRLKLTIQLARLTLALPVNVDKAIMAEQREENSQQEVGVGRPRGRYLPSSIHSVIGLACVVLEKGESVLPTRV